MSLETIFTPLAIIGVVAFALKSIHIFIGANLYDLAQINMDYDRKIHPHRRKYITRPMVSLVMSSNNNADEIILTLESIRSNSYKNVEVIIVDQASRHEVKQQLNSLTKIQNNIRLIARRNSSDSDSSIKTAVKRYAKAGIVLYLEPGTVLYKDCLLNAVQVFNNDESITSVKLKALPRADYTLTSLLQIFRSLTRTRFDKFLSYKNIYDSNGLSLSKKEVYLNSAREADNHQVFASRACVSIKPLSDASKLIKDQAQLYKHLSWPFLAATLISRAVMPLVATYIIFLAFALHETSLFSTMLIVICISIATSIWQESYLSVLKRIKYSAEIPLTFIFIYLFSLANFARVIKPIIWPKFMEPSALRIN